MLVACALGCAAKHVEHTVRKIPAEARDSREHAKVEFEGMLKDKLEKIEEEIRELKQRAGRLKDTAKEKWTEEVVELDAKQKAAREKLDTVTKSTGEAWEHLTEKAWEELEEAVRKARSAL